MSVIDLLRKRRDARTADASTIYKGMVHRIAKGSELAEADVAKLDAAADALGKSPDAIAADVELIRAYAEARSIAAGGEAIAGELRTVRDAAAANKAERDETVNRLDAQAAKLADTVRDALRRNSEAHTAAADAERLRAERPDLFNE